MTYKVVTVATHKEGRFDSLINNIYNIPIKVLGFGQKWTSFRMKYELIYDYIKNKNDNEIIIFLDGFDSDIKYPVKIAIDKFKKKKYKLLFSKEIGSKIYYAEQLVFNTCKNNTIGNTGLYMGYVKYLKIFLKEALKKKCKDDQVVMNNLCNKFDFIDIDYNEDIFQNLKIKNNYKYNNRAIFIGFPGTLSYKRVIRSILDYSQFFILLLLLFYFILFYFLMKNKYKKQKYISISLITFILFVILIKMDYSCL